MTNKNNHIWLAITCNLLELISSGCNDCNLCGKKGSWVNESSGKHYCLKCMEDVAFK